MNLSTFFQESSTADPTWIEAFSVVRRQLPVQSHVSNLFRSGWNGTIEPVEYIKVMGFSRLNPACLIVAADFDTSESQIDGARVEHAISYLGIRLSAVVLAINYTTRAILRQKPPIGWKSLLKEMMTCVEIGYKLGNHAPELGVEGGSLMGFARNAGYGLLMADKPDAYSRYSMLTRKELASGHADIDLFGCSAYQVSALALQQLGFGTEVALGTALGTGDIQPEHISLNSDIIRWKAAYLWVKALREERNYPADKDARTFFRELVPAPAGERNRNLEVLHTDVGKVMRKGSSWTWHLPRATYEETQANLSL